MRKTILFAAVLAVAMLSPATTASADHVYHSEHIALAPEGNAPLFMGFVENIHVNGPQVFALERYVLVGASPNAGYDVALHISIADPSCGTAEAVLPTASFSTNAAGNGLGQVALPPSAADGLHGLTIHIVWTVSTGGVEAHHTACTEVTLD